MLRFDGVPNRLRPRQVWLLQFGVLVNFLGNGMVAPFLGMSVPRWLVLTWRLPSASSTARVATWRSLQRIGAVTLTPGAVIVPYSEHLLEQLEWVAEDVVQRGGDAYVLPVTELPEADEEVIRRRMRAERHEEYERIRVAAARVRDQRELAALRRGLARAVERDHFASSGRTAAERALRRAEKE